jgi:hypothetical protein
MADDLPLPTILRLHASASASDRSEHRNRGRLTQSRTNQPPAMPEPEIPEPAINVAALVAVAAEMQVRTAERLAKFTGPKAKPVPTSTDEERLAQVTWAASAAAMAAEIQAALPYLTKQERNSAAIWIQVLNESARDFMAGNILPGATPSDLPTMPPNRPRGPVPSLPRPSRPVPSRPVAQFPVAATSSSQLPVRNPRSMSLPRNIRPARRAGGRRHHAQPL